MWNGGSDVIGGAMPIGAGQVLVAGPQLAHDDGARREVLGVVRDGRHIVVTHRQPRAAVAVGVGDGALAAQLVPDRVRIGDPLRVGVVEVGREVVDRRVMGHRLTP